MSRLRRMSRERPNWSASIQRRLLEPTLPRGKLQKSQAALQALVTATLQSAGPPRVISRSMSHDLEANVVTICEPRLRGCFPPLEAARIRLAGGAKRRRSDDGSLGGYDGRETPTPPRDLYGCEYKGVAGKRIVVLSLTNRSRAPHLSTDWNEI